jgi:hypothetical protein
MKFASGFCAVLHLPFIHTAIPVFWWILHRQFKGFFDKKCPIRFLSEKDGLCFEQYANNSTSLYYNCSLSCRIWTNYIDKARDLCYNVRCRKVYCRPAVIPSRNFRCSTSDE